MNVAVDFFKRKFSELGVFLNEIQTKAVLQTDGPLLLLATPGSGKTTTIIMRIGYLIEEKGVDPSRIKAVTFSKASALDMKDRFQRFFPALSPVEFSTIHSFAFEVVREHFRKTRTSFQIIEGDIDLEEREVVHSDNLPLHKKIILRDLYKAITGERITDDQLDDLTTYISFIKNKMVPFEKWRFVNCDVPQAERILQEYETFKRSGHQNLLVDFDDMLTIAEQVLDSDQELLRKYQQRYDYILTDESQDTSLVQHSIIEKLIRVHQNVCVVADDDQAIYSWRGAEPSYLLHFKKVYPNAVILFMEQNYRSSKDIVKVANQFIKRNKNRYNKNMFTNNPAHKSIQFKSFSDYEYQAKYLVREIKGVEKLSEVAILYRNNSSSIALMNEFDRAEIPFYMKDSDNRFFKHWIIEDILNFMRLTFSDKRADILEKIHLKLNGYITKQQMASVMGIDNNESVFDNLIHYVQLQDYQVKLIQECKETFQQMRGIPPLAAIRIIRGKLGYEKAIEKMCERLGFRRDYLIGILNTLEEIADALTTMQEFAGRLKHLEGVMKSSKLKRGQNAVTFSTFHSSKGLEFKRVYMIDLIEGIIPSPDDERGPAEVKEALMEEATRLFYVGMTRAKTNLELISYRNRDEEKTTESRFVTEVRNIINPPKQVPKNEQKKSTHLTRDNNHQKAGKNVAYNLNAIRDRSVLVEGQSIKHRAFGKGTIIRVTGERIEVRFESSVKTLAIETCIEMGLLELM